MSNEIAVQKELPPSVYENRALAIYDPKIMEQFEKIGQMMADGVHSVPDHFKGNVPDCVDIVIQSYVWGMIPFVVAQKTHIVGGKLGYEAQLVHSVVQASGLISGEFEYEYSEGWDRLAGKCQIQKVQKNKSGGGTYTIDQPTALWKAEDEAGLWVKAGAKIRGRDVVTWGEKVFMSSVLVRNSPLWVTAPHQQIGYLAVKMWARAHTPGAIMGIYSVDELPPAPEYIPSPAEMKPDSPSAIARDHHTAEDAEVIPAGEPQPETPEQFEARFSRMVDEINASENLAMLTPLELRIRAEFQKEETVNRFNELVSMWKSKRGQINRAINEAKLKAEAEAKQPDQA